MLGASSKATVDGKVDGYLRVLGPLNQPLVRVISQFREGRVNGFSDISGELDLQMEGKTVAINRLLLDDREGQFSASGVYTPGKYLQASVRMSNFPLETIVALTDYDQGFTGRVNLQADFDTLPQGMTGVFSGGISDAFFGKTSIPSFHLTGELDDDLLFINYEGVEDKLKIWGNIPLSPQWFGPGSAEPVAPSKPGMERKAGRSMIWKPFCLIRFCRLTGSRFIIGRSAVQRESPAIRNYQQ